MVVEVDGDYEYNREVPVLNGVPIVGDYHNQRRVLMSELNPNDLCQLAGARPAPGHTIRWTLIKCEIPVTQTDLSNL